MSTFGDTQTTISESYYSKELAVTGAIVDPHRGNLYIQKTGNFVQLHVDMFALDSVDAAAGAPITSAGAIPPLYRPQRSVSLPVWVMNDSDSQIGLVIINVNGDIVWYSARGGLGLPVGFTNGEPCNILDGIVINYTTSPSLEVVLPSVFNQNRVKK